MSYFEVQSGNNMPIQSPLIPDPVVPYYCDTSITAAVIVELERDSIEKYLEPTPFEYVGNSAIIYVNDFSASEKLPYMDGGIIIQCSFQGVIGGYYLFEYEDNDAAVAAGRELWGYPKKLGTMTLDQTGSRVRGTASRNASQLINIDIDLDTKPDINPIPEFSPFPHLNIHTIPKPDGPGIFSKRVIARDNSADCQTLSKELGAATVELTSSSEDPLGDLAIKQIYGGTYSTTKFAATTENGWGQVLATLV